MKNKYKISALQGTVGRGGSAATSVTATSMTGNLPGSFLLLASA